MPIRHPEYVEVSYKPEDNSKMKPAVYILASKKNGTLYVGVSSDMIRRIWEHKNDLVKGTVSCSVWYELHETMESAITREKNLKNWKRAWKLALIEKGNPNWQDLYEKLL